MTNVHSQTNGQQTRGCTVTPSGSKHDLPGGTKRRSGAAGGDDGDDGKDLLIRSSDPSPPDFTSASGLSAPWAARSPTAAEEERKKGGEERPPAGISSPAAPPTSLPKPKRKPAPEPPPSAAPHALSSSSSSTVSSLLLPSTTVLENTNFNNSTSLHQTSPPFLPLHFSKHLAAASPVPSVRFRDTPVLRRAPRASSAASAAAAAHSSTKYQTLPVEEGARSKARRRYSLSEGGSKTHSSLQGGGAPGLGRLLRNKRSQSMSGMLLPKDGDEDSEKGQCDSDWILESTV